VDLLIAKYPDGQRVPGVSNPPYMIPSWNEESDSFLRITMGFAYAYLHDDGGFLLFYPDCPTVRKEIWSFFKNYKMKVFEEWTIINSLHLANPVVPTKKVVFFQSALSFYITLFLFF